MGAELVRGRVGQGPSLLGAEMSSYHLYRVGDKNFTHLLLIMSEI